MPITLLFAIGGIIVISTFLFQHKKQHKFFWIYLMIGILLMLIAIIPWFAMSLQK